MSRETTVATSEVPAVLRSLLFVPAVVARFVEKAHERGADLVCLDLEDSVPPAEKPKARQMVREILPGMPGTGYLLYVRVNALETGLLEEDVAAAVGPKLDGISLPKTHTADIVRQVDAYLTALEKQRGLPAGKVKIIPWIETALGLVNAYQICTASPRVIGASFGGEDFATDMGIQRTKGSKEIEYARYVVATACRAAKVVPIDTPEPDYTDLVHLEEDAQFARSIGYRGKYCIHPNQVEVCNRVFGPAAEEVEQARRVVVTYEDGERQGLGAVTLDGVMIDRPIYVRALQFLEWARASGANEGGE
ncbi:MAG: HpcH/HpaI aldolase/citrate lyase family protein [Dehalococcoidia bacterium]